jgi:antitoxin VapB
MNASELFEIRVALLRAFLNTHQLDGVLLTRPDNFAMATGGRRNYIYTYSDVGANALFVDAKGAVWFVGNTIEAPRQLEEELAGLDVRSAEYLWFEGSPADMVRSVFAGNIASDDASIGPNVHGDLAPLRALLTETELEKYRRLGVLAAEAMTETLRSITPGMPEAEIAARLVYEGQRRRCQVPVALIAADDRIARYRHPLPTQAPLLGSGGEAAVQRYAMVVGCFLREGLVVSLTRFRQVQEIPADLHHAYARVCAVDAIMQEATRPGRTLGQVFAACQQTYAEYGFHPEEWHNHHQGGATGYAGRTAKGAPQSKFPVLDTEYPRRACALLGRQIPFGAAFAWNPSAPGVKSEDTFLLLPDGKREIITATPALPQVNLHAVLGRETEVVKSAMAPPDFC